MDTFALPSRYRLFICCAVVSLVAACGGGHDTGQLGSALTLSAKCAAPASIPSGAWVCPASQVVECDEAATQTLYLADNTTPSCSGQGLVLSDPGPLTVGAHIVTVSNANGMPLCSAAFTVVDSQPPQLESHALDLWPPNHKFHSVSVSDCVSASDACDGTLQGEFIWASSDEPIDSIGDGHFAPDIGLGPDPQHACVRSERQGPKDGRVYKLGVRVVDAAGHAAESSCTVIVDHDQRGTTGKDSGDAYRIDFSGTQTSTACGGPTGHGGSGGHQAGAGGHGMSTGGHGAGAGGNGSGTAGNGGMPVDAGVQIRPF